MTTRIHRHASLISRRKQLECIDPARTHTVSTLKQSIKSRLMFATVRRVLQMDALGCCPTGLQILAFKDLVQSNKVRSQDALVQCQVSVPKAMLLPLIDEMFCSYDSFREALWPVEDPVLAYMSRKTNQSWNSSQDNPVRRAADARIALPGFIVAIQHVMATTLLRQLRPAMLVEWTLHVANTEVQVLPLCPVYRRIPVDLSCTCCFCMTPLPHCHWMHALASLPMKEQLLCLCR